MMIFLSNSSPEQVRLRVTGFSARVWRPLGGPLGAWWSACPSLRSCQRLRLPPLQANQVVGVPDEGEQPADFLPAPQFHLSQHADYFHPTKTLFPSLPFL